MELINVKTGFGYFIDSNGYIVSKAQLPPGSHPIKNGFGYCEVDSQAELDAIEVYVDPKEVEAAANEKKIAGRIRRIAVNELKVEGELPADFEA